MAVSEMSVGESQARRLEDALKEIEAVLSRPDVQQRLRQAPGENEWSAMEILGHCVEMVPFWLKQCQGLIDASGDPPPFGRTLDSPERLEGVQHGKMGDPDAIMAELRREVAGGAARLRQLTGADRDKAGIHPRRGRMTVDDVVRIFIVEHAEEHVQQVRAALGG
jgi:hypothetical protein